MVNEAGTDPQSLLLGSPHTVLAKVTFVPHQPGGAPPSDTLAGDLHITGFFPRERYHQADAADPGGSLTRISSAPTTTPSTPNARLSTTCGCARRSPSIDPG